MLDKWKTMEYDTDGYSNCYWCAWYCHQKIDKGTEGHGNKRTRGDSVIKIGQNTEKSPGDLRRLAVTQTPVEDHQLTLVWKTLKGVK